jgi:hypothetical protein
MPSYVQCTPQPPPHPRTWIEESAFRETTLQAIDDPADREAVRQAGGIFHLALLEATIHCGATDDDPSVTRADLRAVLADLRYTSGYCKAVIQRSAIESSLEPDDAELCRFAGKLGRKLEKIADRIEERLA